MTGVIVHEWIEEIGGSENVLDEIARAFPDAPIYCLWNDASSRYEPGRVRESWLAKTPLRKIKPLALLFMPFVWRRLKIEYKPDWILASSHLFAHHARFKGFDDVKKFAYVHSPARYIWSPELDRRGTNAVARLLAPYLKYLDRKRSKELHSIAANSQTVKGRIENFWNRDSIVIYPPVDVAYFSSDNLALSAGEEQILDKLPKQFVLGASRFVPYKRMDLAIKYGHTTGLPVVLAGSGPDYQLLLKISQDPQNGRIDIVESPSKALLKALYSRASVFVFGAVEDFGIMPVEAMAAGTPVIGINSGGVAETVIPHISGVLLNEFNSAEIQQSLVDISRIGHRDCSNEASKFDSSNFRKQLIDWIA